MDIHLARSTRAKLPFRGAWFATAFVGVACCLLASLRAQGAAPARPTWPRFPLSIADDGERPYLVDRDNKPFLLTCEIAQAMLNRLRIEDVRHYLDVRAGQGYNSVWIIIGTPNAMIDDTAFARPGRQNAYGVLPFENTRDDLSRPNRAYFDYVREIVDEGARRGMIVGLAPDYVGADGGNLLPLMKNAGRSGCRDYGRFVGEFFKDQPNLFWIHHGDHNPYNFGGAESTALVDEFVAGLKGADNVHPRFHTAISRVIPATGMPFSKSRTSSHRAQFDATGRLVNPLPWLNLNHVYGKNRAQYAVMLSDLLEAWDVYRTKTAPRLPFLMLDGVCTYYHDDARANRAQGYYAMLSGAVGFFSGNIRTCWFMSPETQPVARQNWKNELLSPAEVSATHTARFFRSLPWWRLVPDASRRVFRNADDVCAAARTIDGRTAVLYAPTRRMIEVDLASLPGRSIAVRWFNPRSGAFHSVETPRSARGELLPPGGVNDAEEDWVLLLEAAAPGQG